MNKPLSLVVAILSLFVSSGQPRAQDDYGFRFVRVIYDDISGRGGFSGLNDFFSGRGRGRSRGLTHWATDYPQADYNLHEAISRTTNIPLMGEPLALSFNDPAIFEYPVLYLTEPGYWLTNPDEVEAMRKYFARGGFMIIDDFHDFGGKDREWFNMYNNIKRVFPDREPVRLSDNDPIWSIYYDIDPATAPSTKPGFYAEDCEYYGIYDDNGRMMCFISYNQDIGDGWEWPESLYEASTVSYQMGINVILYALTH